MHGFFFFCTYLSEKQRHSEREFLPPNETTKCLQWPELGQDLC